MARVHFEPFSIPLARFATPVAVCRFDPSQPAGQKLSILNNILVKRIEIKEGPHPPVAHFRYAFDQTAGDGRPLHFDQVMPLDSGGPWVIRPDDRLAVIFWRDDGSYEFLFDGFASLPQAGVSGDGQDVSFTAYGVPVREWDIPLGPPLYRDSSRVDDVTAQSPVSGRGTRFNPLVGGKVRGNCVPDAYMVGTDPSKYPVFLDEGTNTGDDARRPVAWTLSRAVRYLLARGDISLTIGAAWVTAPVFDSLDLVTVAYEPVDPGGTFDVNDDTTFTTKPIRINDLDCTGKAWPEALWELVEPYNIGFYFSVQADVLAGTAHWMNFYRKDVNNQVRHLAYQAYRETLDPGRTNVGGLTVARDTANIANRIVIDTGPVKYEASFVLAPAFSINPSDADLANLKDWKKGEDGQIPDPVTYRRFVLGEDGRQYWDFESDGFVTTPTPLGGLLGDPDAKPAEQEGTYVHRPRPGSNELFTRDDEDQPLRSVLWVSTDYTGPRPGVWDGTGTWQQVTKGGWKLLDDRLGIELTMPDPNDWDIGDSKVAGAPMPSGSLKVVSRTIAAVAWYPRFYFRLTTVIDGDAGIDAVAEPRGVSPTSYTITRRIDGRDRYAKHVISRWSNLNAATPRADILARDDTALARSHAAAQQRAMETGKFAGEVTIPRFTTAYQVGNKISSIEGRDMDLRMNVGGDQGESPVYPNVVGIAWNFDGQQTTTLVLSDDRSRPARDPRRRR